MAARKKTPRRRTKQTAKPVKQADEMPILEKRQKYTASAETLLATTGPTVVVCWLPRAGTNMLLRRVDLLGLVTDGQLPAPLAERIASMIRTGGPAEQHLEHEVLAESVQAMRSIAVNCAIQAPAGFYEDEKLEVDDIDGADCEALLVMPGEKIADGQVDISILHLDDIKEISRVAIMYGPAALSVFRRE